MKIYPYKSYLKHFLFLLGTSFIFVITFNIFINPFGVWDVPKVHRINEFIDVSKYERLYKMIQVGRRSDTEVLLLGASSVKKGLAPITYENITGHKTYNAGLDGAYIDEIKHLVKQAICFEPNLQEIILCLNFYMFDEKKSARSEKTGFPIEQVGHLNPIGKQFVGVCFSNDALRASFKALKDNIFGRLKCSVIDEDGKLNNYHVRWTHERIKNEEQFAGDMVGQIPMFKNYCFSSSSMQSYIEILELCRINGIKLTVYINPVHSIFVECIYKSGGGDNFEEWKRQMAALHPIYDFAYISSVGNEPFSSSRRYWRQTQHSMPVTGDLIFARVVGNKLPSDIDEFGILLTKDNVEEMLQKERILHNRWQQENPDKVLFAEQLVQKN